jgi:peptidoglycan/LPS O-acetylase OafA/YrhL
MLDGYSPIFTLVATALALIANLICMRWLRIEERQVLDQSRYPTIDGLRGFLAFFVFLHHAAYWLLYSGSGEWIKPRTKFYTNLGPLGVSLFFMITAFLFIGKILDEPCNTRESWYRTYRSRIYRIVQLYFVAIGLLLLLVGIQTRWIIAEPLGRLMRNVASWIFFNFGGQPDINGLAGTPLIISGVTWTLMYEWAFYLLLPVFAAMLGKKPPVEIFLASLASGIAFLKFKAEIRFLWPFFGGIVAVFFVRLPKFRQFAQTSVADVVVLLCLGCSLMLLHYSSLQTLLLSMAFCLMAAGASIFGLLNRISIRFFGQPAYSVYLIHGLLIHITFRFIFSQSDAAGFSALQYWSVICLMSPVLIVIAHLSFRYIESPWMNIGRFKKLP